MTVKNTSGKVISVGNQMLLPGESCEVAAAYEGNDAVSALVKMGMLTAIKEKAAKGGKGGKGAKDSAPAGGAEETASAGV